MEDDIQVELTVMKSKIKFPGGIARVNSDILPHLHVEKGSDVEVYTANKAIIVKLTADTFMDKDKISMRPPDMEKIGVSEGDKVYIRAHESIGEVLGELKEKIVSRFKGKDGDHNGNE